MKIRTRMEGLILAGMLMLGATACNAPVGNEQSGLDAGSGDIAKLEDQIRGAWASNCLAQGDHSVGVYLEIFGDERFQMTTYAFSDTECQNSAQRADVVQGLFKIRRASPVVSGAYELDVNGSDSAGAEVIRFDLIKLDGDRIYFGANPGSSEAARATQLDSSVYFSHAK